MEKSKLWMICAIFGLVIISTSYAEQDMRTLKRKGGSMTILTFKDCVAAGYPVMESYPRQCQTSDGKAFVSLEDIFMISKDVSCHADEDCHLVNEEYGFACCWAGACQLIDYSQEKWIAVNARWFLQEREKHCPDKSACEQAPRCVERIIDSDYMARCQNKVCRKARKK